MILEDATAVVTGAASGIGRSTALAFARLGANIVGADIDQKALEALRLPIENMGRRFLPVHCDVTRDKSVEELAAQTIGTFGSVDILMNNVGVSVNGKLEDVSIGDWRWILDVNLLSIIRCVRAFLPTMLEHRSGYIVNTASLAGVLPTWGSPELAATTIPYITSKFGVVGFSESLRAYVYPKGIAVSVVCPGAVSTNFVSNIRFVGNGVEGKGNVMSTGGGDIEAQDEINTGAFMEPDEVAQKVVEAMEARRFLILTHPGSREALAERGQYLLAL